ncbi:MAG TPA: hypothetical protein VHC22_10945 [Pirellulales bacterium]|nr:hypothetical protein [Pirellulales bacterium]
MKTTTQPIAIFLVAVTLGSRVNAQSEELRFGFDGGFDHVVPTSNSGDLDGRAPFQNGVAIRVAPGDLLTIAVDNPPETPFYGRSFFMAAEAVTITTEGFFIFTTKKRQATFKQEEPRKFLEIGSSLQIVLILKTFAGPAAGIEFERVYLPASRTTTYRVSRPADVYVRLEYNPGDVEWVNRPPNAAEQQQLAAWRENIKRQGYDEVNPHPSEIRAGNLSSLRLTLTAER